MPKLPDAISLGGRPVAQSQVSVPPGPQNSAGQVRTAIGRVPAPSFNIAADVLQKVGAAQQRILARDSAVDRAKKVQEFKQTSTDELRRLQTEADLSDDEVVRQYRDTIEARKSELLNGHGYGPDSQAQLQLQLENLSGTAMGEATALSLTGKRQAVNDHLGATANGLYESVYSNPNPENILTQFDAANAAIDNMADALTPQEERAWRRTIESNLVKGGITSFIDRGNIEGAEEILRQIGVSEVLSADDRQIIFSKIGSARAARANAAKENNRPFVVGDSLVAPDGRVLYEASGSRKPVTLSEGATLVDPDTGETIAANPKQEEEKPPFGTGVRGGALQAFMNIAPRLEAGEATDEEIRLLMTAVSDYTQPEIDPETGLERRAEVPAYVRRAMESAGLGDALEQDEPSTLETAARGGGGQTVWDVASSGNLTGPVPALGRLVGRAPIIGGGAPEMTSAKSYVEVLRRDLIRALQNNPKFAEGERKAIEKDISIAPSVFDNPDSYKQRLIGIAQALDKRIEDKLRVANAKTTSRTERRAAFDDVIALENFMEALLPPRVDTNEEAIDFIDKNPAGTVVLVKQGSTYVEMQVPEKDQP